MKDFEAFLYIFVKSEKNLLGSLFDHLDDYGDVIVIMMKAFSVYMICVSYYDACFRGRISLMTDNNLTL